MATSLEALGEQYFYLKLNFVEMRNRCETEAEARRLDDTYKASRRQYNRAINLVFKENAAAVKRLKEALEENTRSIKSKHESGKKMAEVLETITAGVELGKNLLDTVT